MSQEKPPEAEDADVPPSAGQDSQSDDMAAAPGDAQDPADMEALDERLPEDPDFHEEEPQANAEEDHGEEEHGRSFAATALMLLIFVLVIFGLSLWLVPMAAPYLPATIAERIMPGKEMLEKRLAAIDQEVAAKTGAATSMVTDMRAEIAELTERLASAEAAAAKARDEAAAAREAAQKSAGAASASAVSESVVADAESSARKAAEAADTATTAATEAGKVASAASRDTAALTRQMTSFEARLSSLGEEFSALSDSLAKAASADGAPAPELAAAFAALKTKVDALADRLDKADYLTSEEADRFATQDDLRSARTALGADMSTALGRYPQPDAVATATDLDSLRTAVDGRISDLGTRVGKAESGAAQAEETAKKAAAASEEAVSKVEGAIRDASLRSAVAALSSRLQNGLPFSGAVSELERLSGTPAPDALKTPAADGVKTTDALLRSFGRNAQAALAADIEANADDGLLGQASARLQSVVAGRPKNEEKGDTTGAILSRVEARLRDGQLAKALEQAETLSDPAKAAMSDWLAGLQARVAAEKAADSYVAGLGVSEG